MQEGIGNGGPIDGYDIAVYHVVSDQGFKLGSRVTTNDSPAGIDSKPYIWPVCLPKNAREFMINGNLKDGFVAGWLDTPPVSQQDNNQLGAESNSFDGVRLVREGVLGSPSTVQTNLIIL